MTILHHLAQAAAVLLLIELLVVLLVILGVAGGLAFGARWGRGKTRWAFQKATGYLPLLRKYSRIGTDSVAKPFIVSAGVSTRVGVTLQSIRRQVREIRRSSQADGTPAAASRPVELDATIAVPVVSEPTIVTPVVTEPTVRSEA